MVQRTCSIDGCGKRAVGRGWCMQHYHRWRRHGDPLAVMFIVGDDTARFLSKVNKDGPTPEHRPDLGSCWLWMPPKTRGYGYFGVGGRSGTMTLAHRYAYETFVRPIPKGLVIDHLCRNTGCVNPKHLEPVTQGENVLRGQAPMALQARQTHCKRGHEFTEANTYRNSRGDRECRACGAGRAYEARRKKAEAEGRTIGPKTHCKHGHEYTTANTLMEGNVRRCRTCRTRQLAEARRRKAAGRS